MEVAVPLKNSIDDAMLLPAPSASPTSQPLVGYGRGGPVSHHASEDSVPPSPSPSRADDLIENRSVRSGSTASRSTNRLSLTLPIAPPSAYPSRPTPVSTTAASFPPTPLDTPSLMSPVDPSDFITAIAAQERRVLELNEELRTAKADLDNLKKQFANHEASRKRLERRNIEPLRPIVTALDLQDDVAAKRSNELEKRKALLLSQQTQQNTPEKSRRRIFRGAHTRTLSLLSPTKPSTDGFVHEDESGNFRQQFHDHNATYMNRYAPVTPGHVAKRASWAPRSTAQPSGVKQIAQDLRHGLWTFVEDLRQATVGDEPITGHGTYLRGNDGNMRSTIASSASPLSNGGDQDTIRATGSNSKPHVTSLFDDKWRPEGSAGLNSKDDESAAPRRNLSRSNTEGAKTKRFSWTPLTVDSYDDNDWSNWDSPNVSSPRWSGTTVNGDIIPSIPEKRDDNETPLKPKQSRSRLAGHSPSMSAGKLEELLPPVLNRLPGNIKRATSDLMKEWERSLYPDAPSTPVVAAAKESPTV